MPDNSVNSNINPKDSSSASQGQNKPSASSSPWDEELPEPEPPKEQVVGTLSVQKGNNQTGDDQPAAFVVPPNIDANAGPKVVTPSNFPNAIVNAAPNKGQSKPPAQTAAPAQDTVKNKTTAPPKPTGEKEEALFTYGIDFASSPPKTIAANQANPVPSTPAPTQSPNAPAVPNQNAPLGPSASNINADIHPAGPSTPFDSAQGKSLRAGKSVVDADNGPAPLKDQPPPVLRPRKGIWPFARKPNQEASAKPPVSPDGILSQPSAPPVGENLVEEKQPLKIGISGKLRVFGYIVAGLVLLSVAVFLTEFGVLSIGLEKVYGVVGLETLWGGLPTKSDKALALSFMAMQDHPDFKIKGLLDLTVDKTKDSDITTPLTLSYIPYYTEATKAILAVADTSSDWSASDWVVDSGTSSDNTAASTPAASDSTASSSTSSQTDQQSYQPYQSVGASTKDIETTLDGFIGQTGNEIKFIVNKAVGSDKINLKNFDNKLWINSDNLVFGGNQDSAKWLEYTINSLSGTSLSKKFLSGPTNGLSIKGVRQANEKIEGVRCYKYEIDEVTLGNSLSIFGVKSDTVQSISGNVWIGIKDKFMHKIDVKITLAPSYPVTQLTLSLDLYDYDVINNFVKVSDTDVYQSGTAGTPIAASTATGAISTGTSTSSSLTETGDTKRKSDLVLIQKALGLYKEYYYSYPTAPVLVKLNVANNILEKLLVPGYISILPKDPKDADGWFYGYKSDGTSYTLSARLENTADPTAVLTDGMPLYFLKNQ